MRGDLKRKFLDGAGAVLELPGDTTAAEAAEFRERWEKAMQGDGIVPALARAQTKFEPVKKTKTGQVRGRADYRYAGLDDVLAAVTPALNAEGIFLSQDVVTEDGVLECSLYLARHGERMEFGPFRLPVPADPQAVGSAETYARRYQLEAALGIAAEEDDDASIAREEPVQQPQRRTQAKSPTGRHPTDGAMDTLTKLAVKKGQTPQNVVDWCGRHLGIETLAEIDVAGYNALVAALRELPDVEESPGTNPEPVESAHDEVPADGSEA